MPVQPLVVQSLFKVAVLKTFELCSTFLEHKLMSCKLNIFSACYKVVMGNCGLCCVIWSVSQFVHGLINRQTWYLSGQTFDSLWKWPSATLSALFLLWWPGCGPFHSFFFKFGVEYVLGTPLPWSKEILLLWTCSFGLFMVATYSFQDTAARWR